MANAFQLAFTSPSPPAGLAPLMQQPAPTPGKSRCDTSKRKHEEDVENGLDPNSMMGRAVVGPAKYLYEKGEFAAAESIYIANQISIVRRVDSDDEGGDEETFRETFSPLNAEGEEAACLLGTSHSQKNMEKYFRTLMMQNRALAVSHFKRQIRTLIF
jgi:hypothetical protein